jgi:outer membrane protein
MKKLAALSSIASVALLFSSLPADAQGIRIGTVDMNRIFSSYYKTKDAESRINEARAAAKKELDDRMENYKKNLDAINKLNEEINKPELSKDAKDDKSKSRDEKIAETKNLEREIGEFRSTREKQLQEQAVRMRNGIVEEITKLVQDRVKTDQFDIVFDRSGSSLNGVPILVFAKDSLDFSEDIITSLNKNKPAGGAASAPAAPAEKKK